VAFPLLGTNPQSPPELLQLYQDVDLCLFPSFAEGCGLPVLESLWMGTPVLASDIPSVLENTHHGGIETFASDDLGSFSEKLLNILTGDDTLHSLTLAAEGSNPPVWGQTAKDLLLALDTERR